MASGFLGAALGGFGGSVVGGAVVQLLLDDKQFQGAMAKAKVETEGAATGFSKFGSVAKAGFAAVGLAAAAGIGVAIEAASNEEEALNKVKVILGQSSTAVENFADTSAESFGIAKAEALSAAGGFAGLFKGTGLAKDAAADMSVQMVKLAADMASFNNIGTDEALEKLKSGLSGEAEPLRAVNVFLNEAAVKSEAYRTGIAKVGDELTDGQKIQARYNLILAQSKDQQGDFARTSGGVANQQRILAAQVKDLAAELGRNLLPVLKLVLGAINALIQPLLDIIEIITSDAWDRFAEDLEKAGASSKTVTHRIKEMKEAMDESNASGRQLGGAMAAVERQERRAAETARGWAERQAAVRAQLDATTEATHRTRSGIRNLARAADVSSKDFKDAVRGSTNFVEAKWEDLAGQSRVTATQIIRQFRRALEAQAHFAQNTKTFADKVKDEFGGKIPKAAQDMIADLAQRGTEGADIMQGLAQANGGQIRTIINQWKQGEEGPRHYLRVLENLGGKINALPNSKSIDVYVNVHTTGSGSTASDQNIADALARELAHGS